MTSYTVVLTTGTVGIVETEQHIKEGMEINVSLQDQNGNIIFQQGIIAEILSEDFLG